MCLNSVWMEKQEPHVLASAPAHLLLNTQAERRETVRGWRLTQSDEQCWDNWHLNVLLLSWGKYRDMTSVLSFSFHISGSAQKVNGVYSGAIPILRPSFAEIRWVVFVWSWSQTNQLANKQTDGHGWKHNLRDGDRGWLCKCFKMNELHLSLNVNISFVC